MRNILIGIAVVVALGAAWYLGSPLFLNKTVDEALPTAEELEVMSEEEKAAVKDEVMEEAAKAPPVVMEEEAPSSEPKKESSGEFKDADSFHRGSGTATVYLLADGSRILRFESFAVTNGPDLRVLLVKEDGVVGDDYVELGRLKGNQGNQNYEIPAELDLSLYKGVIIYCKPFHVVFATASLN
jgi:hypothetical protein